MARENIVAWTPKLFLGRTGKLIAWVSSEEATQNPESPLVQLTKNVSPSPIQHGKISFSYPLGVP